MSTGLEVPDTEPLIPRQDQTQTEESSLTTHTNRQQNYATTGTGRNPSTGYQQAQDSPSSRMYQSDVPSVEVEVGVGETLLDGVKRIKAQSHSFLAFVGNFITFLLSTIFVTILMLMSLALPVAMIVIGTMHKNDCPAEPMIPIYLIVGGAVGLVKDLANVVDRSYKEEQKKGALERMVDLFLMVWLLTGCIYVYRTFDVFVSNTKSPDFCDYTVFWFTFWVNTGMLICVAVLLIGLCCCSCGLLKVYKSPNNNPGSDSHNP